MNLINKDKLLKAGPGVSSRLKKFSHKYLVYFLIRGSKIVYIGSSYNIDKRISHHNSIRWIKNWFTSFYFIECRDYESMIYYEKRWIKKFNPKYNGGGRPSVTYEEWMRLKGIPLFKMA